MAWTKVTKPSDPNTVWNWVNPLGRTTYDDPLNPYDDTQDFYDTVNQTAWTKTSKPNGFGLYTWAGMDMIWSEATGTWGNDTDGWNKITKPI